MNIFLRALLDSSFIFIVYVSHLFSLYFRDEITFFVFVRWKFMMCESGIAFIMLRCFPLWKVYTHSLYKCIREICFLSWNCFFFFLSLKLLSTHKKRKRKISSCKPFFLFLNSSQIEEYICYSILPFWSWITFIRNTKEKKKELLLESVFNWLSYLMSSLRWNCLHFIMYLGPSFCFPSLSPSKAYSPSSISDSVKQYIYRKIIM